MLSQASSVSMATSPATSPRSNAFGEPADGVPLGGRPGPAAPGRSRRAGAARTAPPWPASASRDVSRLHSRSGRPRRPGSRARPAAPGRPAAAAGALQGHDEASEIDSRASYRASGPARRRAARRAARPGRAQATRARRWRGLGQRHRLAGQAASRHAAPLRGRRHRRARAHGPWRRAGALRHWLVAIRYSQGAQRGPSLELGHRAQAASSVSSACPPRRGGAEHPVAVHVQLPRRNGSVSCPNAAPVARLGAGEQGRVSLRLNRFTASAPPELSRAQGDDAGLAKISAPDDHFQ